MVLRSTIAIFFDISCCVIVQHFYWLSVRDKSYQFLPILWYSLTNFIIHSISGGGWIALTYSPSQRNVRLLTRINVLNNSSPVSSIPLTVYVAKGNPTVIQIPIHDDDGDIVRCRNASHQECYHGICTYFPYGILDEVNKCLYAGAHY